MSRIEYADRAPSPAAFRTLCRQAGMTVDEFLADVDAGGLNAALRRAAGRAARRKADPRRRQVELLRRRLSP